MPQKAEAMELHQTMQQQKEHYREQQEKLLEQVRPLLVRPWLPCSSR